MLHDMCHAMFVIMWAHLEVLKWEVGLWDEDIFSYSFQSCRKERLHVNLKKSEVGEMGY